MFRRRRRGALAGFQEVARLSPFRFVKVLRSKSAHRFHQKSNRRHAGYSPRASLVRDLSLLRNVTESRHSKLRWGQMIDGWKLHFTGIGRRATAPPSAPWQISPFQPRPREVSLGLSLGNEFRQNGVSNAIGPPSQLLRTKRLSRLSLAISRKHHPCAAAGRVLGAHPRPCRFPTCLVL